MAAFDVKDCEGIQGARASKMEVTGNLKEALAMRERDQPGGELQVKLVTGMEDSGAAHAKKIA